MPDTEPAKQFSTITLLRIAAGAYLVLILAALIWPRANLVFDLVIATAIPGLLSATLWGLTFWPRARVQIGRMKLRYKVVRRRAAAIAIVLLPFLLAQRASTYLRSPQPPQAETQSVNAPGTVAHLKFAVAIAHLEGDNDRRVETRLRDALSGLDSRLGITPLILDREIQQKGRGEGLGHLAALDSAAAIRAKVVIWGRISGKSPEIGPLYQTNEGQDMQFGGAYLPGDFKLPQLPLDDLAGVLALLVAARSARNMQQFDVKFGNALEPLIARVRALADDPQRSATWDPDSRARTSLLLGIAMTTSADETKSSDVSTRVQVYLEHAVTDWNRAGFPLEWAMAQRNLCGNLRKISERTRTLEPALRAIEGYKLVLATYETKGDRLDLAATQIELGHAYELAAAHQTTTDSLEQAVSAYRAAAKDLDPRFYTASWAVAQAGLGRTLTALSERGGKDAGLSEAIAAQTAAVKVLSTHSGLTMWSAATGELAQTYDVLGEQTSDRAAFVQAIALNREVLKVLPVEHNPDTWASVQFNLATALSDLGEIDSDTAALQQSGEAYRSGLSQLSRDRYPFEWATAQEGLGNTLNDLGQRTSDVYYFQQAIAAYERALTVFSPEREPSDWAWAQSNKAGALYALGINGRGIRYLKESVATYRVALTVLSNDANSSQSKQIQGHLKQALDELHERGGAE